MEPKHREILRKNHVFLLENVEIDGIIRYLYSNQLFTNYHTDLIKAKLARLDKVEKTLEILSRRGPKAFNSFCFALFYTNQEYVVERLLNIHITMKSEHIRTILITLPLIQKCTELDAVLTYLQANNILLMEHVTEIKTSETDALAWEELMFQILACKKLNAFQKLCEGFDQIGDHQIAQALRETVKVQPGKFGKLRNKRKMAILIGTFLAFIGISYQFLIRKEPVKSRTPFDDARDYLKQFYLNECENMKREWGKLIQYPEEFEMEKMYLDLEVISEGQRSKQKITCYQELFGLSSPKTKHTVLHWLKQRIATLWGQEHSLAKRVYKKIVLEGDPGMGKTTYVHKLVQSWANGTTENGKWLNQEFDLIILIRLGEVRPKQNLQNYMNQILPAEYVDIFLDFISSPGNHSRVLFVLDAFDEMPSGAEYFQSLVQHHRLGSGAAPGITLLVTTRISHCINRALTHKTDLILRTDGFNPDVVRANFEETIPNLDQLLTDDNDKIGLLRNPLFIGMIVSIGYVPKELIDLIRYFVKATILRYLKKHAETEKLNHEFMSSEISTFLGKSAFRIIVTNAWIPYWAKMGGALSEASTMTINDRDRELFKVCCRIGLLWPTKQNPHLIFHQENSSSSLFERYQETKDLTGSFPHLLFIEYLAARFVSERNDVFKWLLQPKNKEWLKMQYLNPFSYFLSGISSAWRTHVVYSSLYMRVTKNESVTVSNISCPWVASPGLVIPTSGYPYLFKTAKHFHIDGQNVANCFTILSSIFEALDIDTSRTTSVKFAQFSFSSVKSLGALQTFLCARKIEFENCLIKNQKRMPETLFMKFRFLKSVVISRSLNDGGTDFPAALFSALSNVRTLRAIQLERFQFNSALICGTSDENDNQKVWQAVEALTLIHCYYLETEIADINCLAFHVRQMKSLKRLIVNNCLMVARNAQFFLSLPKTITHLTLNDRNSDFSDKEVETLSHYLRNSSALLTLNVSENRAFGQSEDFVRSLPPSLSVLNIDCCKLAKNVARTLAESNQVRKLKMLSAAGNPNLGSNENVGKSLGNSSIQYLKLNRVVSYKFIQAFLESVAKARKNYKILDFGTHRVPVIDFEDKILSSWQRLRIMNYIRRRLDGIRLNKASRPEYEKWGHGC